MIKIRDKIINVPIEELKEYEKNSRIHTEDQISRLVEIIDKFGFTTPLLIDKNNMLIAGHGRKLAAQRLNMETLPCIVVDDLTKNEIKALRIADNRIAELAETNLENIKEEYVLLKEEGLEYLTGYEEKDFKIADEEDNSLKEVNFTVSGDKIDKILQKVKDILNDDIGVGKGRKEYLIEGLNKLLDGKK